MTCACAPSAPNCALSFGRILLEAADAVGHAHDLGPLVGPKRYEHGFEPTLHAVSNKTRRGRKSAAKDRKARLPVSKPPVPEVVMPREPTPPPVAVPVREPTPPPPPPPPPPSVPIVAKRAIGKSVASSPLSELSDAEHEAAEEAPEDHVQKRTLGRAKYKRRIESPAPEEDAEMEPEAKVEVEAIVGVHGASAEADGQAEGDKVESREEVVKGEVETEERAPEPMVEGDSTGNLEDTQKREHVEPGASIL